MRKSTRLRSLLAEYWWVPASVPVPMSAGRDGAGTEAGTHQDFGAGSHQDFGAGTHRGLGPGTHQDSGPR
ncbi:MAG: hypothetical protein ACYCWW_12585, partial [Deltaproteobacteria bacterium]